MGYTEKTETNTNGGDSTYRKETVRDSGKPFFNALFMLALAIGAIATFRMLDGGSRAEIEALKQQTQSQQIQLNALNNQVYALSQQKPYVRVSVEAGTQ